jgi:HEPN domain-containing protein
MKSNLLDKSKIDYTVAKDVYRRFFDDESYASAVCYHLQQAVEKALKYWISMRGKSYPKTHDISALLAIADGCDIPYPEELLAFADMLTLWESTSRYKDDFTATGKQIEKAFTICDQLYKNIQNDFEE